VFAGEARLKADGGDGGSALLLLPPPQAESEPRLAIRNAPMKMRTNNSR